VETRRGDSAAIKGKAVKFELDGSKYQIVFEYARVNTGKNKWVTVDRKVWPEYLAVAFQYDWTKRVQLQVPITRREVTCRLLRDEKPFADGTIRVNPKLGNSKERLRIEALHACLNDVLICCYRLIPESQPGHAKATAQRIRAAMWRAYSERKMVLKTVYNPPSNVSALASEVSIHPGRITKVRVLEDGKEVEKKVAGYCPDSECGALVVEDADCYFSDGMEEEVWWNYRCIKCKQTFQEEKCFTAYSAGQGPQG
jgi:hypothetical protein